MNAASAEPALRSTAEGGAASWTDQVHQVAAAVRDLLEALPNQPERLCVQSDVVSFELLWPHDLHGRTGTGQPQPTATPAQAAVSIDDGAAAFHVCAPTVGTFYHAPEPGAAPFVVEGDHVQVGQQVGIMEAMKLMLPVEANRVGRVVTVLVDDGQPVEYGAPLVELAPIESNSQCSPKF